MDSSRDLPWPTPQGCEAVCLFVCLCVYVVCVCVSSVLGSSRQRTARAFEACFSFCVVASAGEHSIDCLIGLFLSCSLTGKQNGLDAIVRHLKQIGWDEQAQFGSLAAPGQCKEDGHKD